MGLVVSVASGKGGTGKTTIAVSLALSVSKMPLRGASAAQPYKLQNPKITGVPRNEGKQSDEIATDPADSRNDASCQFLDCDVEEPNAHIFLKPLFEKSEPVSIPVPEIDKSKCDFCGKCAQVCAYNALAVLKNDVLVFANLCHGCGGCSLLCPRKAITEVDRDIGVIESGNAGAMKFVHGKLNIGEAMSPPLIRAVKKRIDPDSIAIIDVPPGTSCPVIEAIKGSHFCVLVTEPTPFGLNDLILAVEVVRKLKIPMGVVINRADSGYEKVDKYCKGEGIPVLLRIPFDRQIAVAYSKGIPLIFGKKKYTEPLINMLDTIRNSVPAARKKIK